MWRNIEIRSSRSPAQQLCKEVTDYFAIDNTANYGNRVRAPTRRDNYQGRAQLWCPWQLRTLLTLTARVQQLRND